MDKCNFAVYFAGDAYSTAKKIMGRQSAGRSFMRGMARTWPSSPIAGVGYDMQAAREMLAQLESDGFRGELRWAEIPNWNGVAEVGTLYYPSPAAKDLAHSRNAWNPAGFSFMGVTFTLSSSAVCDAVAELILPPYQPWDAMICISQCAKDFALRMQEEYRSWWAEKTGATRFNQPQMPVIPLGVDCPEFFISPEQRREARDRLGVSERETVFLFAGRLSFHGKANQIPLYQALERVAREAPVVCIEAGIHQNDAVREAYVHAQRALAPNVRFVWADGKDAHSYQAAWSSADAFVSLSENIQETFGLTPVEAMAAGLPVVVSDWNGYRETVRHEVDGLRVASCLPPPGTGRDLAMRHAVGADTYDFYIGRASMATVIDPEGIYHALRRLALDPELRRKMGAAGQEHARRNYDWPVILRQYAGLADELARIRKDAGAQPPERWVPREDPFHRFSHFSTSTLSGSWHVRSRPEAQARLRELEQLAMAKYAFHPELLPAEIVAKVLDVIDRHGQIEVNALLVEAGCAHSAGVRALMWLWKFDLVSLQP